MLIATIASIDIANHASSMISRIPHWGYSPVAARSCFRRSIASAIKYLASGGIVFSRRLSPSSPVTSSGWAESFVAAAKSRRTEIGADATVTLVDH